MRANESYIFFSIYTFNKFIYQSLWKHFWIFLFQITVEKVTPKTREKLESDDKIAKEIEHEL